MSLYDPSKYKISEEFNHFNNSSRYIGLTLDGEEITDYHDSYEQCLSELVRSIYKYDPLATYIDKYGNEGSIISSLSDNTSYVAFEITKPSDAIKEALKKGEVLHFMLCDLTMK